MPDLVQLVQRTYSVERVPVGGKPVFDLSLEPHERVASVAHYWTSGSATRKTEDHHVTVWIEVRL